MPADEACRPKTRPLQAALSRTGQHVPERRAAQATVGCDNVITIIWRRQKLVAVSLRAVSALLWFTRTLGDVDVGIVHVFVPRWGPSIPSRTGPASTGPA